MQWNKCQIFTWDKLREAHWKELRIRFGTDFVGVEWQDVRDFEKSRTTSADQAYWAVPRNWASLSHYEIYSMLYRIENALRVFVYLVLKNTMGSNWRLAKASGVDRTIDSISKQKQDMAADFGHLAVEASHPILSLTCDELVKIIVDLGQWKYFKKYFPAKREIVQSKFEEIIQVRNHLAHFRPVNEKMSDLVRLNSEHLLPIVETYLNQAIYQEHALGSRIAEKWHRELNDLLQTETRFFRLGASQSADKEWIKITLVTSYQLRNYAGHRVTLAGLLSMSPNIREAVSYVYEDSEGYRANYDSFIAQNAFTNLGGNDSINIPMVFSKAQLSKKCDEVRGDLERIVAALEKEYLAVEDDEHFAGDILQLTSFSNRDVFYPTDAIDCGVRVNNFYPRSVEEKYSDIWWPEGWYPDEPQHYISSAWWYPLCRRNLE